MVEIVSGPQIETLLVRVGLVGRGQLVDGGGVVLLLQLDDVLD